MSEKFHRSSLTPEPFSDAQIDFLRSVGVRVVKLTTNLRSNQSVFNDRADLAEGRIRQLRNMIKLAAELLKETP